MTVWNSGEAGAGGRLQCHPATVSASSPDVGDVEVQRQDPLPQHQYAIIHRPTPLLYILRARNALSRHKDADKLWHCGLTGPVTLSSGGRRSPHLLAGHFLIQLLLYLALTLL